LLGELEHNKGLAGFADSLTKITTLLDPLNDKGTVGKAILGYLGDAAARLGQWLEKIDLKTLETGFLQAWTTATELLGVVRELGAGILKLWRDMGGAESVEKTLIPALKNVATVAGATAKVINFLSGPERPTKFANLEEFKRWQAAESEQKGKWFKSLFGGGENAAQGMADGIKSGTPSAVAAAEDMANKVAGATRTELKIHSPSRVFHDLGAQTPRGFVGGVESGVPGMQAAMARTFSLDSLMPREPVRFETASARPTFAPLITVAGGAGGGGRNITVNLTVNMNGGDSSETAPQVEFAVREAMQRVFEQMGSEA
jgi:Flp pilus assembly pilin Flp